MKRLTTAVAIAISTLLISSLSAAAQDTAATHASQQAFRWLQCTQQQANGQLGSAGNPIARSAEVAISLSAAGQDAAAFKGSGQSLAEFLNTVTSLDVSKTDSPVGTDGELLLARVLQPKAGLTAGPIADLKLAKSNGEYGSDIFSDALAILGLQAAHIDAGADAVRFLDDRQNPQNHGWSFDNAGQFGSDSNTTALVIQALLAAGVAADDPHIAGAFEFMATQFVNGGFVDQADSTKPSSDPSNTPDANSDELAMQAILAAGLQTDASWSSKLSSAKANLLGLQIATGSDAGAFNGFSKLFASSEAPIALLGRSLTASTKASSTVTLLPCAAAASASPSSSASSQPVSTTRLAQTGQRPAGNAVGLLIVGILMIGAGLASLSLKGRRRFEP
ncbi:MAG TPA: hypothetical protein VIT43_00625 [Candidatus Dormibacteraeota bacterium]